MRLLGRATVSVDTAASVGGAARAAGGPGQPRAGADRAGGARRRADPRRASRRAPPPHPISRRWTGKASIRARSAGWCACGSSSRRWSARPATASRTAGRSRSASPPPRRSSLRRGWRRASPRSPGPATRCASAARPRRGTSRLVRAGRDPGRQPRAIAVRSPLGHGRRAGRHRRRGERRPPRPHPLAAGRRRATRSTRGCATRRARYAVPRRDQAVRRRLPAPRDRTGHVNRRRGAIGRSCANGASGTLAVRTLEVGSSRRPSAGEPAATYGWCGSNTIVSWMRCARSSCSACSAAGRCEPNWRK